MAKIPNGNDNLWTFEVGEFIKAGVIITVSETDLKVYVAGLGDDMAGIAVRDLNEGDIINIDLDGITEDVAVRGVI